MEIMTSVDALHNKEITAFEYAFTITDKIEGGESDHPEDPGGHTWRGISRTYWPDWPGWPLIDSGIDPPDEMVQEFYRLHFWNRISGDCLARQSVFVAAEVFGTSVNTSVSKGSKILQEALCLLNCNGKIYPDIVIDGRIGPVTVKTLARYLATESEPMLLKLLNDLQSEHYINLMRRYPEREEFRGWFKRV